MVNDNTGKHCNEQKGGVVWEGGGGRGKGLRTRISISPVFLSATSATTKRGSSPA